MHWTVIVAIVVVVDAVIAVVLIGGIVRSSWSPLVKSYPPCEPTPDAVRRNFQSFKLGMLNLGYAVHVAADETHLHLQPARFMRVLGMGPASIPWSSMDFVKRSRNERWTTVRVGMQQLMGPSWCLDLAEPTP